jgi:hypothetical protein
MLAERLNEQHWNKGRYPMTNPKVRTRDDYPKGSRWRVTMPGAKLWGMVAAGRGCYEGWNKHLQVGDIITSDGTSMTSGDGVPAIKWLDENGDMLAVDCCFAPTKGGMWDGEVPEDGYLEPVEE